MAETAWPSAVRGDYDPDKAVRTGRAAALVTRGQSLLSVPWQIRFNAVSTASSSYVTLYTAALWLPDWAAGLTLSVALEAQRSAANTASWRIIATGIGNGADVSITSGAGSYAESTATLAVGAAVAAGVYNLEFQGKIATSGSVFLRSIERCTAWYVP